VQSKIFAVDNAPRRAENAKELAHGNGTAHGIEFQKVFREPFHFRERLFY
jgi:hypothetical protein